MEDQQDSTKNPLALMFCVLVSIIALHGIHKAFNPPLINSSSWEQSEEYEDYMDSEAEAPEYSGVTGW